MYILELEKYFNFQQKYDNIDCLEKPKTESYLQNASIV